MNDLLAVWIGMLVGTLAVGIIVADSGMIIASLVNLMPPMLVVLILLHIGGAK
jgi:hypothetical protein